MHIIKKTLRIINNDSNYSTFYIIQKSLHFYDIVKMNTIKFMFRTRNNVLPINLQNLYSNKLYNTYLFHRFNVRIDRKYFCLSITGPPRLYNNLDNSIRKILNFNLFKITFYYFFIYIFIYFIYFFIMMIRLGGVIGVF